ncbi:MAG TPA: NrtA/SsuA/CpmA family ABC transporter substrate-binding protein [Paracoccus sp. (in: a-proteobacteria)]|uniref:ABC transporter substrate-binding protein n=1 Tax=Paracoccus sp. TaxID=267 RepID=UPI002C4E5C06|nr:NrtA/SsuA/CpmA family ABC transporter substrate-binding protein [Paracoccus sp. (in: a-proteobacteria)]HWL58264.1 NrtA/SsuA/CpmA family ABC transporter substrate-binding protein [Paracoccus sp. (in: a-proteobacteria)]
MKILTSLAVALSVALGTMAAAPAMADTKKVAISYVTSPFNVPSIVMRKKGFLDEAFAAKGVTLTHPEITSGAAQTQAIAAGELQIASVLGGTSAILARANGADVTVIGAYARSPKAYFIMTGKDGVEDVKSLKGKKVAGPKGTVLNQLLAASLAAEGMTLDDIEYLNMDLPTARAALLAGQVDAATLAGANAIQVEAAGGRAIIDGEGLIAPTTVIGSSKAFAEQNPDLIAAYFEAHLKALDFIRDHEDEALQLAAEDQGISIEEARKQFALYDFTPAMTQQDIDNLAADQDFMIEAGMLEAGRKIDIKDDLILPSAFDIK